jgi:glutamyl-tRNA reductase
MIEDNLDAFLDEFGEPAIIKSKTVQVIFDNDYQPMMADFSEGRTITACIKSSDVELLKIEHLDSISIRNKKYRIDGVHPAMDDKFKDLILTEA